MGLLPAHEVVVSFDPVHRCCYIMATPQVRDEYLLQTCGLQQPFSPLYLTLGTLAFLYSDELSAAHPRLIVSTTPQFDSGWWEVN